jgi:hypothetical protein
VTHRDGYRAAVGTRACRGLSDRTSADAYARPSLRSFRTASSRSRAVAQRSVRHSPVGDSMTRTYGSRWPRSWANVRIEYVLGCDAPSSTGGPARRHARARRAPPLGGETRRRRRGGRGITQLRKDRRWRGPLTAMPAIGNEVRDAPDAARVRHGGPRQARRPGRRGPPCPHERRSASLLQSPGSPLSSRERAAARRRCSRNRNPCTSSPIDWPTGGRFVCGPGHRVRGQCLVPYRALRLICGHASATGGVRPEFPV